MKVAPCVADLACWYTKMLVGVGERKSEGIAQDILTPGNCQVWQLIQKPGCTNVMLAHTVGGLPCRADDHTVKPEQRMHEK